MVAELARRLDAFESRMKPPVEASTLFASFVPIPKSMPLWESSKRFLSICAGVRSGKTYVAARKFIKRIFEDRKAKLGRLHYWCVAPTYDLSDVQREYIDDLLWDAGIEADYNVQKRRMTLPGDIVIWFKSTVKPKTLRARGVHGMWLDEAAAIEESIWFERLYSRLTDAGGWAIMTSTPEGENWFFKWCLKAPEFNSESYPDVKKDNDVFFINWFTADNTAIPNITEEVSKARDVLPPWVFNREYQADFQSFKGQVYKEFLRSAHVIAPNAFPQGFSEVRVGVDWGFNDPGVMLVWGKHDSDWYCIHEEYHRGVYVDNSKNTDTWVKRAIAIREKYRPWIWLCDPSEPAYIGTLSQYNLGAVVKATNDIAPGILRVATLMHHDAERGIKPRLYIGANCPNLIREIMTYRYDDEGGEVPIDKDNHALDAMRYALNYGPDREVRITR